MESRPICADTSIWVDALAAIDRVLSDEVRSWIDSGVALVAPDLVHYEITLVLAKHVRNRRLAPHNATEVMDALLSLSIELIDDDELHRRALAHSLRTPGLSGYDAQFIVVCERSGAELWTADKGLAAISQRLGIATRLWVSAPA